jgi:photosystem II stability/assembly factor-like uncharacterized protein
MIAVFNEGVGVHSTACVRVFCRIELLIILPLNMIQMQKTLFAMAVLMAGQCVTAQTTWEQAIENIPVRSIGPAVTSGRVTAIDVDETDGSIYVGSASGGVWKSESGGVTWKPLFDQQPVLGIGAIKVDPVNPNYVWVGTGEGNPRNSHTSGAGVYLSQDAGKSWINRGLEATKNVHRIAVDPSQHSTVYVGAFGNIWAPNKERGVYKTLDFGKTWTNVLFLNDTVGCADLIIDPQHPQKLFAAMYHYQRQPYHFQSGGQQSGLYMTNDAGDNWVQLNHKQGLPEGPWGRIGLAMSPSNTAIIYALIECKKTGLYKSENGGVSWNLVTTEHINDRPFYYHELYVDPANENHLIYLHSTVSESIDGGKSWSTIVPYWGVHPDHHAFWWNPKNPKHLMEGNDGGYNQSYDGGKTWSFAANLPLGQFYHIQYDMQQPYNVYGGMQDNGSWKGVSRHFNEGGIRDSDWQEVAFGDGFDVVTSPFNNQLVYAMSQGGYLVEINLTTNEERLLKPVHPADLPLRYNWNSALEIDEGSGELYYGSQFLHKSSDRGASWQIISPDLTTNDTAKIKLSAITGGLTPDRTSAETYCTILSIDVRGKLIVVGTDDGNVQVSRNGGESWQLISSTMKGLPKNAWISQVHWGIHDAETIYVVANNYRFNDWNAYLFRSTDGGKSWRNLAEGKGLNGHCLSFAEDLKAKGLLFLGTEHGLYASLDNGTEWHQWKQNFPNVAVQDLKIHPRDGDLIIGTFGRSAYIIDCLEPLREWALHQKKWNTKPFELYAIEPQILHSVKRPVGQRFPADGTFEGDNLSRAVAIVFYAQLDTSAMKQTGDMAKGDKSRATGWSAPPVKEDVKIYIRTITGDTLRQLTHTPDSCINIVHWNMDTKGIRWPSLREPDQKDGEPGGGLNVLPGKYEALLTWGNFRDSAIFEIVDINPGITFNPRARAESEKMQEAIRVLAESANKQMEWIRETERSIKLVRGALVHTTDSTKKQLVLLTDSLVKKLAEVKLLYFLPEDSFGINDDNDRVSTYLWMSLSYADARSVTPGKNAEDMMSHLKNKIDLGLKACRELEAGLYRNWQNEYNRVDPTIFKSVPLD